MRTACGFLAAGFPINKLASMRKISLIWALGVAVFAQDQDEIEKARRVFTPEITRAVLSEEIPAPEGFDKEIIKKIGEKRLKELRGGAVVEGIENDAAAVVLKRLGVKIDDLNIPRHAPDLRDDKIEVKATGAKYKIATGTTSGEFKTGQDADIVLSAIDFNNTGGPLLFNHPMGISSDGKRLLLADTYNNRVLIWNSLPASNVPPDIVLGQKDFIGNNSGAGLDQLNFPVNVATGGGKVVVADTENHRLLVWNQFPTKNGQPADLQIGGIDDSGGLQPRKDRFYWPWGVWTDGERLAVSSTRGGFVLIWNKFPTRGDQPADILLRADFGTPRTITSNGKCLIVGDHNAKPSNSAGGTFVWKKFPTKDDEPYDYFMNTHIWRRGNFLPDGRLTLLGETLQIFKALPKDADEKPELEIRGYSFRGGDHVGSVSAGGRLYICTGNRNCVVVYNSNPTKPEQKPDFAIGSPDIETDTLAENFIISNPVPYSNGMNLFVTSDFDGKMYVWKNLPDESGAHPDYVYTIRGAFGVAGWKDTLATAGRKTVCIWRKLPLAGEMPDVIFKGKIGSAQFKDLRGVAIDDKYFYLSDREAKCVYVWKGIPSETSEPALTLHGEDVCRLSSDGNYLCVAPLVNHYLQIYRVDQLSNDCEPEIVGNTPGKRAGRQLFNMCPCGQVRDGKLYVAESAGSKVHIWNHIRDAIDGKPADVLLGETNPPDRIPETARDKVHYPWALCHDGNYLWVGEVKFSERLLRFSRR